MKVFSLLLGMFFLLMSIPNDVISQTTSEKIGFYNDHAFDEINVNSERAIKYVDSALVLNTIDSTSYLEFSKSFTVLGILNKNKGYYQIAVSNYLNALRFATKINDSNRVSVCYNNIGVVYSLNLNQKEAVSFYRKSIAIEEAAGNRAQLSIRYYNMGESFQKMKLYDSSYFYFDKSLNLERELNDDNGITYSLFGISNLFQEQNEIDSAKYYLNQITQDSIPDLELRCKIFILKSAVNFKEDNIKIAEKYAFLAHKLSKEYGYIELEITSLEQLKLLYKSTNQLIKEAKITDELFNISKKRYRNLVDIKISELQKLYEKEVQDRELEKLKNLEEIQTLELENSKRIKSYLFFAITVVVIIFIINIFSLNRMRNKNN